VNYEAILSFLSVDVSTKFQKQIYDVSVAILGGKLQGCALLSRED
jgi:hypothetical protein